MASSKSRLTLQLLESAHLWWAGSPITERVDGRLRTRQPMSEGADSARIDTMLRTSAEAALLAILALAETAPDAVAFVRLAHGPAGFITWEYAEELLEAVERLYGSNSRFRVMMRLIPQLPEAMPFWLRLRYEAMCPSAREDDDLGRGYYADDDDEDDYRFGIPMRSHAGCDGPCCPCQD
jgi:hypothetical protein